MQPEPERGDAAGEVSLASLWASYTVTGGGAAAATTEIAVAQRAPVSTADTEPETDPAGKPKCYRLGGYMSEEDYQAQHTASHSMPPQVAAVPLQQRVERVQAAQGCSRQEALRLVMRGTDKGGPLDERAMPVTEPGCDASASIWRVTNLPPRSTAVAFRKSADLEDRNLDAEPASDGSFHVATAETAEWVQLGERSWLPKKFLAASTAAEQREAAALRHELDTACPSQLISILRDRGSDAQVAEQGWREVWKRVDADGADSFLRAISGEVDGAAEAASAGLEQHADNRAVTQHTLRATFSLCRASSGSAQQVGKAWKGAVAKAGGIEAILGAMRAQPQEPSVQEYGCAALGLLMADSSGARTTHRLLVDSRGVNVIVGAMRTLSADKRVQDWGCVALNYLALGGAYCVAAAEAAGAKAVLQEALKTHAASGNATVAAAATTAVNAASVGYAGRWALAALTSLPEEEEDEEEGR